MTRPRKAALEDATLQTLPVHATLRAARRVWTAASSSAAFRSARHALTHTALGLALACWAASAASAAPFPEWSGIYPHLAFFNDGAECGTGAVVPWADRLWALTYSPHEPRGSTDKLYEIDDQLGVTIRPESIGGTPANRMIHRESGQLFIGPYAIDRQRQVRAIPYERMPGRPTGNARHLTDPAHLLYYASMEEGFYEVNVHTLEVRELYPDANQFGSPAGPLLPGYHGKGLYSGQGRLVYANNGEHSPEAQRRPDVPSGCLAEWDGTTWHVVRRNQFTEVTGPGGLEGNPHPATDPLWSIGWDHRSLILALREPDRWHFFRLPKASHSYDGAHGWNTEWPRIRDVGEPDLLMTMHGMFWRFPRTFSSTNTAGVRPRSTYLKVIGDFCRWSDRLVFGCDDAARSEFLNKRRAKGQLAGPGQSQSNLWFTDPDRPDRLGPVLARGAVWLRDRVNAGEWSDPYLFAGTERRGVHLAHTEPEPVTFTLAVDRDGRDTTRKPLRLVTVPANGYAWVDFASDEPGEWVSVRTDGDCAAATVVFVGTNADRRPTTAAPLFAGLASVDAPVFDAGLIRARGENHRTLHLAATSVAGRHVTDVGYYELDAELQLHRVDDPAAHAWLRQNAALPSDILAADTASVVYVDDDGHRWRLPKGDPRFDDWTDPGLARIAREVVTERDLFNAHGIFYELPAINAGGFAKIRPLTTHNRRITDFCSYRGLLVLTGIQGGAANRHVRRSDDGRAAVWVGAVDDLWQLGKAVGRGGPWRDTPVRAGQPSDPYLMTGFDRKTLHLAHQAAEPVDMQVEVDLTGDGPWVTYRTFAVPAGTEIVHEFPAAYQACWLRVTSPVDTVATAQLDYR